MSSPYDSQFPQGNQMSPYNSISPNGQFPRRQSEHPQSLAVLVLGVLGCFVPLVSFWAWYLGNVVKRESGNGSYASSPTAEVGRILGIAVSVLTILGVLGMALFVVVGLSVMPQ